VIYLLLTVVVLAIAIYYGFWAVRRIDEMIKQKIEAALAAAIASINAGEMIYNAVSQAVDEFDWQVFIDTYGDAVATKIADGIDEDALDALVQKILDKLL